MIALLLLACATTAPEDVGPEVDNATTEPPEATWTEAGEGDLTPEDRAPGRDVKRMNVDQLSAAITQATGLQWTDGQGEYAVDAFELLAGTLGRPDYLYSTHEDLDPSVVFEKFLNDAAISVCTRRVADELSGRAEAVVLVDIDADDTWDTNPDAIEANLQRQVLRFHGAQVDLGSPELQEWTWLWRSVHDRTGDTEKAWRTTCAGLILHPSFYTY